MHKKIIGYIAVIGLALLMTSCSDSGSDNFLPEEYYTDMYGWNTDKGLGGTFLGRGINLGNFLEAPRGPDPDSIYYADGEGSWTGGIKVTQEDIQRIAAAGFAAVRIPCKWSDYFSEEEPYGFIEINGYNRLDRVKEILGWISDEGMKAVLNVHHYDKMMTSSNTSVEKEGHIRRLEAIWDTLSREFPLSEYSADSLVFELLNEPHTSIGYSDWNGIIARLVDVIWTDNAATQVSGDTRRIMMVGTANWGGVPGLDQLDLPEACTAENIIITVHYYEPFKFTHQGAEWNDGADAWIGTRWLGSSADQAPLVDLLDSIGTWNTTGFEIFVGEFGVYSKYSDPDDQKAWTAFICRESEKRNYSWAYWEYAAGFGAYDPALNSWRPQLLQALIPVPVD